MSKDTILNEARQRKRLANDAWRKNHQLAFEDVDFRDGDQWSEEVKRERKQEQRPMLTFNRIETYIDKVVGNYRESRMSISVAPSDMHTGKIKIPNVAGDNDYDIAKVYEGLIRQIEYASKAQNAYDTALDHSVGNGFGFFRIVTEYADDTTFEQEIRIRRIRNPFSVVIDPTIQTVTGEDMKYAFIGTWTTAEEFERQYGFKPVPDEFEVMGQDRELWWDGERVRIEEYFRKISERRKIVLLESGETIDIGREGQWARSYREIERNGGVIVRERVVDSHRVEWFKINGARILEGPIEFPSKYIPIVLVPGKELVKRGETVYRSLIRYAKDAQRNYNYWRTAATEMVALAPKAPYVGPISAFKGLENIWKDANVKNYGFLPYNDGASAPPRREQPGTIPTGALEEAQSADYDIKATIGIYESALGEQGNEKSGKAIIARQRQAQVGTFIFIDNLARAIEHCGRILVDMIPRVYDTDRVIRIRNEDGSGDFIRINMTDGETGRKLYDIGVGKYDIQVKTGPAFSSQREEAADTMLKMVDAYPELIKIIGDKIAANMDWPGADQIAKRLRAIVPPEVLSAEKSEDEDDLDMRGGQALSIEQVQELVQEAVEQAKRDMELQIKQFEAETKRIKALGDIQNDSIENEIDAMKSGIDREQIKDIVAEALAEFIVQSRQSLPVGVTGNQSDHGGRK